jgi:4-amino-4-deoxy-L-arabinose transferase-like glycosyltransferase
MSRKKGGIHSPKKTEQVTSLKESESGSSINMASKGLYVVPILFLAFIIWYGFYGTHTKGVTGSDDREYAAIARNIVEGKGIVRNLIYPVDVKFFSKPLIPEFHHPPGYPLIIAGFFKVFGISDFVALLPSYLSYFLLVTSVFLYVKRQVDLKAAVLASILIIFNKEILDASLISLSEMSYTLAFFLFFVVLVKAKNLRDIFFAGVLLGLSQLIRKSVYPFLVPLFIYFVLYHREFRWKKMVTFTFGLLLPILPFLIRSYWVTGSPFFSYNHLVLMSYSHKYPEMSIWRDINAPSLIEFLKNQPGVLLTKYLSHFMILLTNLLSVSNSYVLALGLSEMLYWKMDSDWKRTKVLFLLLFFSQILFVPLNTFQARLFIPFLPVLIVFASQACLRVSASLISDVNTGWRKGVTVLLALLACICFIVPVLDWILRPSGYRVFRNKTLQLGFLLPREEAFRLNEFLDRELKRDQIVWTDFPEVLEWEGNRMCGWLPLRTNDIFEIHRKIPVDAILLTTVQTPSRMGQQWRDLLFSEQSLPQYRTMKFYESSIFSAKLLIRDKRE